MNLLDLYFHPVHDVAQRRIPHRVLHQSIDVDTDDAFTSGGHAARAQRVGEGVVLQFVPKSAAGCETVYRIGSIDEEAVSLRPHLRDEILPFEINVIVPVIQKIHRLHGEREQLAAALLIEPAHEALL